MEDNKLAALCADMDNTAKLLSKISIIVWILSLVLISGVFYGNLPMALAGGILFILALLVGKCQSKTVDAIAELRKYYK